MAEEYKSLQAQLVSLQDEIGRYGDSDGAKKRNVSLAKEAALRWTGEFYCQES